MDQGDIKRLVFQAKLAEQAERFGDMCNFIKQVVHAQNGQLDEEERRLLAVAYKNRIAGLRRTMRIAAAAKASSAKRCDAAREKLAQECMSQAGEGVLHICKEIDGLLGILLKAASEDNRQARVQYLKMAADSSRYRAEADAGVARQTVELYERASRAAADLPPADPIRLSVALNYSVFRAEIEGAFDAALGIARAALGDASQQGTMTPKQAREAMLVRQLLKDNIDLWSAEAAALATSVAA